MNVYVIIGQMEDVGGGENYADSKVKYLQENNWKVVVFSRREKESEHSQWPNLDQFWDNRRRELCFAPEFWSKRVINRTIEWMEGVIGKDNEKIIIESNEDFYAEWGEILAEKLNAKHICFLLGEQLELRGAKEFLYFKYLRGELAGIHKSSIPRLFHNYKELGTVDFPVLKAVHYTTVQDVRNDKIDHLTKRDWNIAYIGRNKQYVNNIVDGIMKFAFAHSEKQIQFLILGDVGNINNKIPDNLHIVQLGFITPIPKKFFECVDAAIAGAGCARIAQAAGVLTIVADAGTCMSSGLLGYTTFDILFGGDASESFDVALENALVKEIWKNMPYESFSEHSAAEVEQCYLEHFDFIDNSNKTKEYFDFQKHPQKNIPRLGHLKYYTRIYMPAVYALARKIKRIIGIHKGL